MTASRSPDLAADGRVPDGKSHWLPRFVRTAALGALEGGSIGMAVWLLLVHARLPEYVRDNRTSPGARRAELLDIAAGVGVALAIVTVLAVWRRAGGIATVERLVRRASPLALAGLVPLLFDHRLWGDRDIAFLVLAAAFGFGARQVVLTVGETEPAIPQLRPLSAVIGRRARAWRDGLLRGGDALLARLPWPRRLDLPWLVTIAGATAYALYFAAITITSHRNLRTSSFDMGLEDNLMWNLVHGVTPIFRSTPFDGPTGTHLRNHATFFSYVLAPIYRLVPGPETLLVLQAALIGAAAVPLHLYSRRHLSPWMSSLVALLYLAYPPLHGANLYDYHYLPLGIAFLWLVLYAAEARRPVLATIAAVLAMSVREDVACLLGVLGVFLLLSGAAVRAGAILAVLGVAYFLVMKLGVMPHFGVGGSESFVNQYAGLVPSGARGFGSVLETIVGNPGFTENVILEREKLIYVLELLVPLLFLPVTRPIGLLLVAPGVLFTLMSTGYAPLYQISFQYTSYWTVFLFVGVVLGLERAGAGAGSSAGKAKVRQRALAVGIAAASLACTYLYGAVLQHETVRGGFERFRFGTTEGDRQLRSELATLVAEIPADARVSASEHVVPHVSSRENAYTLRFGIYDADYVLAQLPGRDDERVRIVPILESGSFGVVDSREDFLLLRRGGPTTSNGDALRRVR